MWKKKWAYKLSTPIYTHCLDEVCKDHRDINFDAITCLPNIKFVINVSTNELLSSGLELREL